MISLENQIRKLVISSVKRALPFTAIEQDALNRFKIIPKSDLEYSCNVATLIYNNFKRKYPKKETYFTLVQHKDVANDIVVQMQANGEEFDFIQMIDISNEFTDSFGASIDFRLKKDKLKEIN